MVTKVLHSKVNILWLLTLKANPVTLRNTLQPIYKVLRNTMKLSNQLIVLRLVVVVTIKVATIKTAKSSQGTMPQAKSLLSQWSKRLEVFMIMAVLQAITTRIQNPNQYRVLIRLQTSLQLILRNLLTISKIWWIATITTWWCKTTGWASNPIIY
jgi:hypothetical protein